MLHDCKFRQTARSPPLPTGRARGCNCGNRLSRRRLDRCRRRNALHGDHKMSQQSHDLFADVHGRRVGEWERLLINEPELLRGDSGSTSASKSTTIPVEQEPQMSETSTKRAELPPFPKAAWRGIFSEYRSAMEHATE